MKNNIKPRSGCVFVKNFFKKNIEIPEDWNFVPYEEALIEIESPIKFDDNAEYQLITAKRGNHGLVLREILKGSEIKTKNLFSVESGDFIIAKMQIIHGACGTVPPKLKDAAISGSYIRFKPQKNLDLNYFNWFCHSQMFYQHTFISSVGSNLEKMTFDEDHWLKHKFPLPGLIEQKQIAKILTNLQTMISQQEKIVVRYRQMKKGLIQNLLLHGINNSNFQEVNIDKKFLNVRVPSSWKFKPIKEVLIVENNPIDLIDDELYTRVIVKRNHGSIVLRDVVHGKEILTKNQFQVKSGDFIISNRQIIHNACGLIPDNFNGAVVSNEYTNFSGSELLDIKYFDLFSQSLLFQKTISVTTHGIDDEKYLFLSDEWLKLKIPLPEEEEQQNILSIMERFEKVFTNNQNQLKKLLRLKKGLIQKLVTGRIGFSS